MISWQKIDFIMNYVNKVISLIKSKNIINIRNIRNYFFEILIEISLNINCHLKIRLLKI